MNKGKRSLVHFFLAAFTCILLVSLSTVASFSATPLAQFGSSPTMNQPSMAGLWEAESVLIAQGMTDQPMQRYVAVLTNKNVFPKAPSTSANGSVGAALVGDRLVVRGSFRNLTSTLRDYAADPTNPPNPKITSGVHIHQGEAKQNGPFQYALTVTPESNDLNGQVAGEYTLTSEQLQALSSGKLYVDLHTKKNRAGELRGIFQPINSGV